MIFNKYIDEYIELVESGEVVTNEDIKKSIKIVKNKLSQSNVTIEAEKMKKRLKRLKSILNLHCCHGKDS